METKLTLKLDKDVIDKIKMYAQSRNISLSKMVEKYFRSLTSGKRYVNDKYSPIVKELSGIIKIEDNTDYRDKYTDYLVEKYR